MWPMSRLHFHTLSLTKRVLGWLRADQVLSMVSMVTCCLHYQFSPVARQSPGVALRNAWLIHYYSSPPIVATGWITQAESHMLTQPGRDHNMMFSQWCHPQNELRATATPLERNGKNDIAINDVGCCGDNCHLHRALRWRSYSPVRCKRMRSVLKLYCWHLEPRLKGKRTPKAC